MPKLTRPPIHTDAGEPYVKRSQLARDLLFMYRAMPDDDRLDMTNDLLRQYDELLPELRQKILKLLEGAILADHKLQSELAQILLISPIPNLESEGEQLSFMLG